MIFRPPGTLSDRFLFRKILPDPLRISAEQKLIKLPMSVLMDFAQAGAVSRSRVPLVCSEAAHHGSRVPVTYELQRKFVVAGELCELDAGRCRAEHPTGFSENSAFSFAICRWGGYSWS